MCESSLLGPVMVLGDFNAHLERMRWGKGLDSELILA